MPANRIIIAAVAAIVMSADGRAMEPVPSGHAPMPPDPILLASSPAAKPAEPPGVDEPAFVRLQPFSVAIWKHKRVTHQVFLTLTIDVADEDAVEHVRAMRPRLRDAFIRELNMGSIMRAEGDGLDYDGLGNRLTAVAKRLLGDAVVNRVLIADALSTAS
ncbi:hypothetical protein [Oceanibacterium hippocampi]|uniref:Flagellar protein FliL n=1 Tax=Oceanibacterium hippocampi TaxID=745714 RepID=A0A1Y5SPE9_9PROT|nr:hypothetical protein [Oceanibacterium hippocampi]SLN44985.1 hypothetical protein OCH7691_01919 [Oceanibacterium hippocampi]